MRYKTLPTPPMPEPPTYAAAQAQAQAPFGKSHGFHLIGRAYADTIPVHAGGSANWGVQVGSFASPAQAHAAAAQTHGATGGHVLVTQTQGPHGKVYSARVVGLSHETAAAGCGKAGRGKCIVVSPAASRS